MSRTNASILTLALTFAWGCSGSKGEDPSDGGSADGGATDGGSADGGAPDGGSADGGAADGGSADGGSADGGSADGGSSDGGGADGGGADGGSTEPMETITDCETTLATPGGDATCTVAAVGTEGLLLRGDVLSLEGAFHGGSVLIDAAGLIACVGCDCSANPSYATATTVDCPEGVVSPGLINAHEHVTFSEGYPLDHGATRFDHRHEWRETLSIPSNSDTVNGTLLGELRMLMSGVTSMIGSGSRPGLVRNLDSSSNSGLAVAAVAGQTFPLGDSDGDFEPDCAWNYSDEEGDIAARLAWMGHVAEGIDAYAAEEFRCLSDGFEGVDATEANTAQVHGIGLHTLDYAAMVNDGTVLVWSPRSDVSLYGQTAQAPLFLQLGGTIALGTTWTLSGSMNMARELACAAELNESRYDHAFSSAELWRMATEAGAMVARITDQVGALRPGLQADITVFASGDREYWDAVIGAQTTDVALVMRSGTVLYGEAELVAALNPACDTLTVCEQARGLCATAETGSSYEEIIAAVPDAYPAFDCDEIPAGEPTCVPSRPGEYAGIADDDSDGDGLIDTVDLCPSVFSPLRPIDESDQPDLDLDGVGDACDATPLPLDVDGDGVHNEVDVCPWAADDQADEDGDGKGDACDPCPSTANPDRGCP